MHQSAADGKSQTGSLLSGILGLIRLFELPEDHLLLVLRNTDAFISDSKIQLRSLIIHTGFLYRQPHFSAGIRIFDRIAE